MTKLTQRRVRQNLARMSLAALSLGAISPLVIAQNASAAADAPLERLAGTTRAETAAVISQDSYADASVDTLVLATKGDFGDALASGPLAAFVDGPMLLTPQWQLEPTTRTEIERVLSVDNGDIDVYIVGGDKAIGSIVEQQVRAIRPDIDTKRLDGPNRIQTGLKVDKEMDSLRGTGPTSAFVVNAWNYPDALAAVGVAGNQSIMPGVAPILLTHPNDLPDETAAYLSANAGTLQNVYVVGGTLGVSDAVLQEIDGIVNVVERIAGYNRFETAAALAERFYTGANAPTNISIVRGYDFADALAGGPHAAKNQAPVLLVHPWSVPAGTANYVSNNAASIEGGWVYGGIKSVSDATKAAVEALYF